MKNKKGFTLIELLAVIVILGVLISIVIPRVSQYINNSRKGSFVSTAKEFADSVEKDATQEDYPHPIAKNDVVVITLDKSSLEKIKGKSAFGGEYVYGNTYVAIINISDGTNPEYRYFVAMQDTKNYAIPLTERDEVNNEVIVTNAKNKMEVTIQTLCGEPDGYQTTLSNISGLEKYQPTDANGSKIPWNVIIYSTEECGK